jgi:uncharacterized repeat protein (TIGR01451 family)
VVVEGASNAEPPLAKPSEPMPLPISSSPATAPAPATSGTLPPFTIEPQPAPIGGTDTVEPPKPSTAVPLTPSVPGTPTIQETTIIPEENRTPLPSRQSPNITIEMVAAESTNVGQPFSYELVARNIGTSAVMNLRLEDEVPARTTLIGSEPAAETSGNRLSWILGTLEANAEKRVKITVKPLEEGTISSRAHVSFSSAVDLNVKVTRPIITVAVTGPNTMRVGEKVPFQIKLSNTGTGPASKVVLQAQLSEGLSHPAGQFMKLELANLAAGQTQTFTLEAIAAKSGAQSCVLTATADENSAESAKATLSLVEPMLQIKQSGPAKCLVKSEPVVQIDLSNPGTAATDTIQVVSRVPAGFEFLEASDHGAYVEANGAVVWKLPAMAAGSSKSITMKLRANAPSDGTIRTIARSGSVEASIQQAGGVAAEPTTGVKPLEAQTELVIKSEGIPALRFEVFDVEDPIPVGKDAVYEIRVMNQGTGPCTNIQIIADLSEGTTATGATGPTNGRLTGQQIEFEPIPELGVKSEMVYRVRVKGNQNGDHHFRVRLSCDQIRTPVVKEENTRFYKD